MATGAMMKFDYGDSVRISDPALLKRYGIRHGSVCGFREAADPTTAETFGISLGTILVLVEGSDGTAVEIPEECLEHF